MYSETYKLNNDNNSVLEKSNYSVECLQSPPPDYNTMEQMKQLQTNFYSNTDKNFFLKNNQKNQCAVEISKQMNLQELLDETMYIIPDTNKVFFNYTVFKLYANPQNYDAIILNALKLFKECIQKYNCYEIHMDLKTFTISAATRYMTLIQSFCNECLKSTTEYSMLATNMFIYNTPGMMDQISKMLKPLVPVNLRHKFVFFSKTDSPAKINQLHSAILVKQSDIANQSNSFA